MTWLKKNHKLKLRPNECSCHEYVMIYTILPKVLGHPLLMKGLTTLVISMSTNLNV